VNVTTELYGRGIWLPIEETATEVHSSVHYSAHRVEASDRQEGKKWIKSANFYILIEFKIVYAGR